MEEPFLHFKMYNAILAFWRELHEEYGYQEILAPVINHKNLWETSGHWGHYKENMFLVTNASVDEETDEETGEVTTEETTRPATDVIIESITVDTKGIDFGLPETNEIFDINSWYLSRYRSS